MLKFYKREQNKNQRFLKTYMNFYALALSLIKLKC